jgi:hypothetical protein
MNRLFFLLALTLLPVVSACTSAPSEGPDQTMTVDALPKQIADARHGKETAFAIGALSGKNDTAANGVTMLHRFEDNVTVIAVRLNITKAAEGFAYEATLESADGTNKFSLGAVRSVSGDENHALRLETADSLDNSLQTLRIRLRQNGVDTGSGTLVAEGVLKTHKR